MNASPPDGRPEPDALLEEEHAGGNKARFMVSLGKPQLAALRSYAGEKGLSVAEVLRRAVDEFLDRRLREPGSSTPQHNTSRE